MVTINFKNVGQGDSIILEWKEDKISRIAIIDCNLYEGRNPCLDYVIGKKYKSIEFLLLSHPHEDHYSGFKSLIEGCLNDEIEVKKFLHTSLTVPDFLRSASRNIQADTDLFELFSYLKKLRDNSIIEVFAINKQPDSYFKIPLGNEFSILIESPSAIEQDNFIKGSKFPFDEEVSSGNPSGNWLSTVLIIENNFSGNYALLTSDALAKSMSRIKKIKPDNKLILSQYPHHGSKANQEKSFWQTRKRAEITPIVISVGKNSYKHPSEEVIRFFEDLNNYEVYTTMKPAEITEKEVLLDLFSKSVATPKSSFSTDKKFLLHQAHAELIIAN